MALLPDLLAGRDGSEGQDPGAVPTLSSGWPHPVTLVPIAAEVSL